MDITTTQINHSIHQALVPPSHDLYEKTLAMLDTYWEKNPDLHRIVQLQKQNETAKALAKQLPSTDVQPVANEPMPEPETKSPPFFPKPLRGPELQARIQESYREIRGRIAALDADIVPRTQASDKKSAFQSVEEEQASRADVMEAQVKAWRSMLPTLIKKFAKIPDYRRAGSVKHKTTVLLMFGLFGFVFKLSSRREMNRELTGPVIFEHLKKIFPEIDSIPHADTLARLLENTNPKDIEAMHISLIKDLINKKKFKKLLIQDCLPISIDGAQKLYRDGLRQDSMWCERQVGNPEDEKKQQYVYVLEANITFKNGLSIPLMTEYLYRETNEALQSEDKQDNETTAFERMAERLKGYFPRLKMIFFMDALYAVQPVMEILHNNHWEYIIRLPKRKLTDFADYLNNRRDTKMAIPGQAGYRERRQEFHWETDIAHGYEWQLTIHLVACTEEYEDVDKKTGKIIKCFSEHAWISSIRPTIHNVHELLNLGARKKEFIEDNFNTEKNRGYHYKHAFSYNWKGMQGFHYLMRLGHAINAICEFTKKLKKHIKENGVGATLKIIKDTLSSPWLPSEWYDEQSKKVAELRLQLE